MLFDCMSFRTQCTSSISEMPDCSAQWSQSSNFILSRQLQLLLKNDETNIPSIFQFNRHQNNTMTSSSPDTVTSFETRSYYCRAVWQSCQIVVPHLTWFGDFNGFKRRAIAILTLSLTIATVWGLEQTQTTITYFTLILKSLESS